MDKEQEHLLRWTCPSTLLPFEIPSEVEDPSIEEGFIDFLFIWLLPDQSSH